MIFNLKIYKEKMNTSVTAGCIVFSLQRVRGVYSKCNFPFPHVFSLSPFPLCVTLEGTHDDRVAGGQHSVLA